MASKKELIRQARTLGLETKGTATQIAERIIKATSEDDAEIPEEAPPEDIQAEPVKEEKISEDKIKTPLEIPRAIPAKGVARQVTAIATKTCVKYVAGWRKLVKGKPITASGAIIADLKRGGFVE